jgi:nucleoside-diphosphate-sugar epimerase
MEEYEKKFVGKNVMITGGLGFIGSNLAKRLAELNPENIFIVDSMINGLGGNLENLAGFNEVLNPQNIFRHDIADVAEMTEIIPKLDYIFNLAGSVSHIDSKNNPLNDLNVNLASHVAFLQSCRYCSEQGLLRDGFKIVFSSTRDAYGKQTENDLPIVENTYVISAADPQGIHNQAAEFHHLWFGRTSGFDASVLRLTNTYGPRQKIDTPTQGFIGYFIYQALKGKEIQLWGGGESLRDFNHVDDVADALLMTMASEKTNGEIYNLGCFMKADGRYKEIGNNIKSVGDAARTIVKIAGTGKCRDIPYPEERKAIEPGHVYLDATKIHDAVGWFPKISFEEGIKNTIEFYRKNTGYWRR